MNRGRNILKKTAAVAMSSSMILAGGSNVWAAGSYQETARASLQTLTESVAGAIDGYAQDVNRSLQGSKGTLTLKVEDTGKAIIGSMLGQEDLTWLQDLKMDMDISVKDGIEAIDSAILLNGEKICNLNIYQDMAEMTQYIQVPEISDAYIAVKTVDGMNGESQEIMQTYMNVLSDLGSVLPDAETTRTLLDRYGTLVIDSVEEGNIDWKIIIRNFYPDLAIAVEHAEKELEEHKIEDEVTDTICEECGRNMVIKYGPHGRFLACPGFPDCRNTKPYYEKIGVSCPKCGKDVVLKKTKKGRKYYGCIDNPDCDFMSWQKPSTEKCPECGGYMLEKGNKLVCADEQCGFVMEKPKKEE